MSLKCSAKTVSDLMSIAQIEEAMRVNLSYKLLALIRARSETNAKKKDFVNSISANEVVRLAQEHIRFITFQLFRDKVETIKC